MNVLFRIGALIGCLCILFSAFRPLMALAEEGRKTTCVSNYKQLGLAQIMYVQDYDEMFPSRVDYGGQAISRTRVVANTLGWNTAADNSSPFIVTMLPYSYAGTTLGYFVPARYEFSERNDLAKVGYDNIFSVYPSNSNAIFISDIPADGQGSWKFGSTYDLSKQYHLMTDYAFGPPKGAAARNDLAKVCAPNASWDQGWYVDLSGNGSIQPSGDSHVFIDGHTKSISHISQIWDGKNIVWLIPQFRPDTHAPEKK